MICITAGLRRQPNESRLDLINRNVDLFVGILDEIAAASPRDDAVILVVSNPVDVLTYLGRRPARLARCSGPRPWHAARHAAVSWTDRPSASRSRRRRSPRWCWANMATAWCRFGRAPPWRDCRSKNSPAGRHTWPPRSFDRTKKSGAEVIRKKGGAGFAVGIAIQEVIENHRARPATDPAGLQPASRAAMGFATWRFPFQRSSDAAALPQRTSSNCGPKRCRQCGRVPRYSERRSTRCSSESRPSR